MKKVVIVGVGALGSHVAMLLRNEAELKVVDFDSVEQKNVMSQFYGRPGVRKPKVQALSQAMQLFWGSRIEAVPHRLTDVNDAQLLSGCDLMVDCLDNGPSRRVVQGFARRTGTPCLHGALAADGGFGRSVWDECFAIDESAPGAVTCDGGEHLPFISVVSSFVALSAQLFLSRGIRRGFQVSPSGSHAV